MNTNFENLPSLNSYLASSIENIIHHAEDKQTEINNLIQVMRQNEGLLTPTTTHPRDLVQYLKLADTMRDLTKEVVGSESNPTLDNVISKLIQQLNHVSRETYLQTLAVWIDENKIPLNTLNLSKEEMLELAPHLTYLDLSDWGSSTFGPDLIGDLLEKTEKLTSLTIDSSIGTNALSKFKNTQQLKDFETKGHFDEAIFGFVFSNYLEDPIRGAGLFKTFVDSNQKIAQLCSQMGAKMPEEQLWSVVLFSHGVDRNEDLASVSFEKLRKAFSRNDIPFVKDLFAPQLSNERELMGTPRQQVFIRLLFSVISTDKFPVLKEFLASIGRSPVFGDYRFVKFVSSIFNSENPKVALEQLLEVAFDATFDPAQQLKLHPYLISVTSDEKRIKLLENLKNLLKTGHFDDFMAEFSNPSVFAIIWVADDLFTENSEENVRMLRGIPKVSSYFSDYYSANASKNPLKGAMKMRQNFKYLINTETLDEFLIKFPPGNIASSILTTEDLFTGNSKENVQSIQKIDELETEFNKLKNDVPIPRMPWAQDAENLSQTPAGKAFIKLHFHEIVMESNLQDIVLRAFSPSKQENLALYPMESYWLDEGEGIKMLGIQIRVVPTLPVADAPHLLKLIVNAGSVNRIKIDFYGSPGVDHSGLGRQFVSEVMQGYVINQSNLFIRSAGGGVYPYDSTRRLGTKGNSESYKDLGRFLGMVLRWQYPTGKVLSEKLLGCMLSFKAVDLDDANFDVAAFVAKKDSAAFIKFIKEATDDDEGSVKLYEKVFLSENTEEILEAAGILNSVLMEDKVDGWIAGGVDNIKNIQDRIREMWIEDHSYSLNAAYAMAQGMKERLPKEIDELEIINWDDMRLFMPCKLSEILQGELTPQYVKEHMYVRVIGGETPENLETANNVRKWTEEWLDANGDDPEKLANFVQAFSGARSMTKDIYLDINPAYHTIVSHTCFYRADLPVGVQEGFVKMVWDDYSTGNLKFDVA